MRTPDIETIFGAAIAGIGLGAAMCESGALGKGMQQAQAALQNQANANQRYQAGAAQAQASWDNYKNALQAMKDDPKRQRKIQEAIDRERAQREAAQNAQWSRMIQDYEDFNKFPSEEGKAFPVKPVEKKAAQVQVVDVKKKRAIEL